MRRRAPTRDGPGADDERSSKRARKAGEVRVRASPVHTGRQQASLLHGDGVSGGGDGGGPDGCPAAPPVAQEGDFVRYDYDAARALASGALDGAWGAGTLPPTRRRAATNGPAPRSSGACGFMVTCNMRKEKSATMEAQQLLATARAPAPPTAPLPSSLERTPAARRAGAAAVRQACSNQTAADRRRVSLAQQAAAAAGRCRIRGGADGGRGGVRGASVGAG